MAPDRHSLTELHRATVDSTGANVTDGYLAAADGAGNVEWIAPGGVGVTDHGALTGLADDDHSAYLKKIEGGQDTISAHGAMGATETFDPTAGNVHTGTLDANCTFTLGAPVGSGAATLELYITASGTRTWTWPGSVVWPGGVTPDPPADTLLKRILLETLDGGTTWYGTEVGGGGSALTVEDEGTPLATAATTLDFVGAGVTASGAGAEKTITIPGATTYYEVLLTEDGTEPITTEDGLDWLYVEVSI